MVAAAEAIAGSGRSPHPSRQHFVFLVIVDFPLAELAAVSRLMGADLAPDELLREEDDPSAAARARQEVVALIGHLEKLRDPATAYERGGRNNKNFSAAEIGGPDDGQLAGIAFLVDVELVPIYLVQKQIPRGHRAEAF